MKGAPVARITSTSSAVNVEHACLADLTQPISPSIPRYRVNLRQAPPPTQLKPSFQYFKEPAVRKGQRWPVKIRRIPSRSRSAATFWGSSTDRQREGSGVTTVTSQPNRAK